jgi:NAD dependent epimerase/dehydratase family enzyme
LPIPKFALELAFGEFAKSLFSSARVIPEAALGAGFRFDHPELETALRMLF